MITERQLKLHLSHSFFGNNQYLHIFPNIPLFILVWDWINGLHSNKMYYKYNGA